MKTFIVDVLLHHLNLLNCQFSIFIILHITRAILKAFQGTNATEATLPKMLVLSIHFLTEIRPTPWSRTSQTQKSSNLM